MSEAQVILEYRQVIELEQERNADSNPDNSEFHDDSYEQELRELGVTPEMLDQMRGK